MEIGGFSSHARVTSDCRPWPAGGKLGVCTACALVQKIVHAEWRREVAEIYACYALYHQSRDRTEQTVFDPLGRAAPRSGRLLQTLQQITGLPPSGRMLDVGCGNGATLQAASELLAGWSERGLNVHEATTLASIIAREAILPDEVLAR